MYWGPITEYWRQQDAQRVWGLSAQTALGEGNRVCPFWRLISRVGDKTWLWKWYRSCSLTRDDVMKWFLTEPNESQFAPIEIPRLLCLNSSFVYSRVSAYYSKYLLVYLSEDFSLNAPVIVDTVGAASLHLRLPQEFHSERPQQEEEKDQWWWRRVTRPRCGSPWGDVGLLLTCVVDSSYVLPHWFDCICLPFIALGGPFPAPGQHVETLQATLQAADQAWTEQGPAGRGERTQR